MGLYRIRKDIIEAIGKILFSFLERYQANISRDDPYSHEQLKDPRMNAAVIRPLVDKWYQCQDISVST
jgi:hypothetical protein